MSSAYRQSPSPHRALGPADLAQALQDSRRDTLATFAVLESALSQPGLRVPYSPELNPPLWELGHIGWFQDWWLARNPHQDRGLAAEPDVARRPSRRSGADTMFDSSRVPHPSRWDLALPDAQQLRQDLAAGLVDNLALLQSAQADDTGLYFHRLCLAHEDMHHEASVYMAQALGIALPDPRWQSRPLPAPGPAIKLPASTWTLGSTAAEGFVFDNELGAHPLNLPACSMDAQVLRWQDYLPFIDAGGYGDARWWPGPAGRWRQAQAGAAPRYLRRTDRPSTDRVSTGHMGTGDADTGDTGTDHGRQVGSWEHWRHGAWQALDLSLPACHLTAFEAQAFCNWAGRRLPTEAEWERAAITRSDEFNWGQVWEWTASTFAPYPGFVPHPYRDYSAPWFGSRPVLRGASVATQPRLRHPRYRNYFTPERNDIFAGFRTCAL